MIVTTTVPASALVLGMVVDVRPLYGCGHVTSVIGFETMTWGSTTEPSIEIGCACGPRMSVGLGTDPLLTCTGVVAIL